MERRTFLQGAAATAALLPALTARAQQPPSAEDGTVIYSPNAARLNDFVDRGFNPLERSAAELHELGLPYPDRGSPLYPIWRTIYGKKLRILPALPDVRAGFSRSPQRAMIHAPILSTRFSGSRNWSGAQILPHDDQVFTEVAARWTLPALPAGTGPDYASTIWVGLDGQRRYFDSSLPQIGTWQGFDPTVGAVTYNAWYEWWERGQPGQMPFTISQFPLAPGDQVLCIVQVVDPTHAILAIIKFGTPILFWYKLWFPQPVGGPLGPQPRISGATAEWVVERPTKPNSDVLYELPDYGQIAFSDCVATMAIRPWVPPVTFPGIDNARLIRMFGQRDNPSRTVMLSAPTRMAPVQDRAFLVDYIP
jgi:Peptidase A4 family